MTRLHSPAELDHVEAWALSSRQLTVPLYAGPGVLSDQVSHELHSEAVLFWGWGRAVLERPHDRATDGAGVIAPGMCACAMGRPGQPDPGLGAGLDEIVIPGVCTRDPGKPAGSVPHADVLQGGVRP